MENLHVLFQPVSFGQMESTLHVRDITHQIHRQNFLSEENRTPEQYFDTVYFKKLY